MDAVRRTQSEAVMRGHLVALLVVLLCIGGHASAGTPAKTDEPSALQIRIEATRPQISAGTGFGASAELVNASKSTTVYLTGKDITLVLPPEVDPQRQTETVSWFAYFPTEVRDPGPYDSPLALRPGDKYKVFFSFNRVRAYLQSPSPVARQVGWLREQLPFVGTMVDDILSQMEFVFFAPGEYKVTVVAKYWTDPHRLADDYHTTFETMVANITAPQFVILFGAALGGLIAYFIFPHARQRLILTRTDSGGSPGLSLLRRAGIEAIGILGSVLLSMIITIMLSRISETQFLIRITVADLWGSIAIGFAANYAGSALLTRMLGKVTDDEKKPAAGQPAVGGATGTHGA